jgi:hypothetical protein
MPFRTLLLIVALVALAPVASSDDAPRRANGFTLEPSDIPVAEILAGGPTRDGIPALTNPEHSAAAGAPWSDDDLVMGVAHGGEARAYPLDILVWHELVNDTVGGRPILVSYCPLCGTGIVFDRRIDGSTRTFGVSGLLYRSDLLLYDRETESLWSQISSNAVTGPSRGKRLTQVRARTLTWAQWRERHPETTVLTHRTGHARRYGQSPYGDYAQSAKLYFPAPRDDRYHPKMPTVGLRIPGGAARAFPASEIQSAGGVVEEEFEGRPVRVAWDGECFLVDAPDDVEIVEGYWFAWAAFHPHTTIFTAPGTHLGQGDPVQRRASKHLR